MTDLAVQQNPADWEAIRLRYEVLGESPLRLSLFFSVPVADIEALADAEGWASIQECTPGNLESYVSTLFDTTQNKIHLMAVYRELSLLPVFHTFEETMMQKLQLAAQRIDPFAKDAPRQLNLCLSAYEKIADRYTKISDTLVDVIQKRTPGKAISLTVDISGK